MHLAPLRGPAAGAATLEAVLEQHFQLKAFRSGQRDAIVATLGGHDSVVILPTGAGKSLTFQFPPFTMPHAFTVVISPLLALAKDQVDQACDRGIDARVWNSEVQDAQRASVISQLCDPEVEMKLLYTTPESLRQPRLRDALKEAYDVGTLLSFAVDEAHCVSEWGHDFRPAYLELATLKKDFPNTPIACLTASCTARVQSSITQVLGLKDVQVIKASFNRPNIQYQVVYKDLVADGCDDAIMQDMVEFVKSRPGQTGIIYARLRATCDTIGKVLEGEDVDVAVYHAGKDTRQRNRVQSDWSSGAIQVVVATVAFGMGVDCPHVRWVLHYNAPTSMEGLYQESGRAGRDGAPCASVIYASRSELEGVAKMEKGTRNGAAAEVAKLLMSAHCRRKRILSFFGESRGPCDPSVGEQPCDFCCSPSEVSRAVRLVDKADERKSLAAAVRARMCGRTEALDEDDPANEAAVPAANGKRSGAAWSTAKQDEQDPRAGPTGTGSTADQRPGAPDHPQLGQASSVMTLLGRASGSATAAQPALMYGAACLPQPTVQPAAGHKRALQDTAAAAQSGGAGPWPGSASSATASLSAPRVNSLSRPQIRRRVAGSAASTSGPVSTSVQQATSAAGALTCQPTLQPELDTCEDAGAEIPMHPAATAGAAGSTQLQQEQGLLEQAPQHVARPPAPRLQSKAFKTPGLTKRIFAAPLKPLNQ